MSPLGHRPHPPFGCAQCPLTAALSPLWTEQGRASGFSLERPHANWIAPLEKGFISLNEGLENKNIARQWLRKPSC